MIFESGSTFSLEEKVGKRTFGIATHGSDGAGAVARDFDSEGNTCEHRRNRKAWID
jgi:hypothetical protein